MKRVLLAILATLGLVFGLVPAVAGAQALPVVTPGMALDVGRDDYGCTMGAIGTDSAGRLIGISAAHCLKGVGGDIFFPGQRDIGPIGTVAYTYPNGGAIGSEPDYSVVVYDKAKVTGSSVGHNITVNKNGPRPPFGQWICKSGQTTGHTCGFATYFPDSGNTAGWIFVLPGDSGGPLVYGTTWAGIVSRIDFELRGPMSFASADRILADLNARGGPGAGFVPLA